MPAPDRPPTHKSSVLGIGISPIGMERAVAEILDAGRLGRPLGVSALAVHGVMTAKEDPALRARVNELELVVPDGQPVRWALRLLDPRTPAERVAGPDLMEEVCAAAAAGGLPVYLFGSTIETLGLLEERLKVRYPALEIAGRQPSRFRAATERERLADLENIRTSGARIVFVGLGCPRQEIWAYENRMDLSLPVLAVGAAFDYHAGLLNRAPDWLQRAGLEWAYRLWQEPRRLWRRYAVLNPLFLYHLARQKLGRPYGAVELGDTPLPVRPS